MQFGEASSTDANSEHGPEHPHGVRRIDDEGVGCTEREYEGPSGGGSPFFVSFTARFPTCRSRNASRPYYILAESLATTDRGVAANAMREASLIAIVFGGL
jgi:hypothetical protein